MDSDNGRPAGLTLESDKAKRFLNSGMNKQIGRTINLGE
jgi:hypothetical protein